MLKGFFSLCYSFTHEVSMLMKIAQNRYASSITIMNPFWKKGVLNVQDAMI